jgi:hypothetical protein
VRRVFFGLEQPRRQKTVLLLNDLQLTGLKDAACNALLIECCPPASNRKVAVLVEDATDPFKKWPGAPSFDVGSTISSAVY